MTAGRSDQPEASSGVQLAEVVASIALAADLGIGQPVDHVMRTCVVATRFAEHIGASQEDRDAAYWSALFLAAGCTGVSFEMSRIFGDDIAFRAGFFDLRPKQIDVARYLFSRAGSDKGFFGRTKVRFDLVRTRLTPLELTFLAHCAVSAQMADRLGLGETVADSLRQTFTRWDGKGIPKGLGGDEIVLPIRLANLANYAAGKHRIGGVEAAIAIVTGFSGTEIDPHLAAEWQRVAGDILANIDAHSQWDAVVRDQPAGRGPLTEGELDAALELIADYADLKSPWFIGHSRAVAELAVAAGELTGLPDVELVTLRRAALVHDIGRNGVPNTIWDKPGPLSASETEKVRLHSYYTDRVLHRAGKLANLANVASAAHERADGTGYPRGVGGQTIPLLGRLLAAADVYQAMIEDRPHRPARSRSEASNELRRAAREGELDGAAVDAVLTAAGHPTRKRPSAPAGLTAREVEVLVAAARGATTKTMAAALGIAPKTVGNHIERIYTKIGVSTRAEAAMFAMRHGLVPSAVEA